MPTVLDRVNDAWDSTRNAFRSSRTEDVDPPPANSAVSSVAVEDPEDDSGPAKGLHAVLKKTDYWFNLEYSGLEREARDLALKEAQAGLPRADVQPEDELPVETVLRGKAVRIYLDWSERVKRGIHDSVHAAIDTAADALISLRDSLEHLERGRHRVQSIEDAYELRKQASAAQDRSFEYGSLFRRRWYLVSLVVLLCVDWVANIPIFQQLIPMDPSAQRAWLNLTDTLEQASPYLQGIERLIFQILFRPDVSLLALGVVAILMLFAHFLGKSMRRIAAFRPKDETTTIYGLKSHRRQSWVPVTLGLLGMILIVGFLYYSRGELKASAAARLTSADSEVRRLEAAKANAKTPEERTTTDLALQNARDAQSAARSASDYADSIDGMNKPIFMLNIGLVTIATLASYMESKAKIGDARLDDPELAQIRYQLEEARAEVLNRRQEQRRLSADIQAALSHARYLSGAVPLRDWEAKAQRLEAIIPGFRSENARVRGIDVPHIAAFRVLPRRLELPMPSDDVLTVPPEVEVYEQNFIDLRTQASASGTGSERV